MAWFNFKGEAPYDLGMATRARAHSVLEFGKVVELIVYVVIEGQGPDPKPVSIKMPRQVANDAATALIKTASRHLE
jgi:hypothetical protein